MSGKTDEQTRFEFRCWLEDPAMCDIFDQSGWHDKDEESRTDLYLFGPDEESRALVKLREGQRLEVKYLTDTQGNLEKWEPLLSRAFPLSLEDIKLLETHLRINLKKPEVALQAPAFLIASLVNSVDPLSLIATQKYRRRFSKADCLAETVQVRTQERELYSLCLEAEKRETVQHFVTELGLETYENLNYGAALMKFQKKL